MFGSRVQDLPDKTSPYLKGKGKSHLPNLWFVCCIACLFSQGCIFKNKISILWIPHEEVRKFRVRFWNRRNLQRTDFWTKELIFSQLMENNPARKPPGMIKKTCTVAYCLWLLMVNVGEYTSPMDPKRKYSDLQQHWGSNIMILCYPPEV